MSAKIKTKTDTNNDTKKKVLVVDDDDNMRSAVYETIKRMGIHVDTASHGEEGFEKATKQHYDFIISDMRMPVLDGHGMFRKLRQAGIQTPLCFITAYGTVDSAVECIKEGATDYVLKPFSPEVIEELVRRTFYIAEHQNRMDGSPTETTPSSGNGAVFASPEMSMVFGLAKEVAPTSSTILITGESGTGKEVFARYIHQHSLRKDKPFVAVNCAALPETLIESELFGHEKGAFTGAISTKLGKFEIAHEGTLLLDEIGEIPMHLQAKLLRVLQEREIDRIGSTKSRKIDVRILATTNRDLLEMIKEGDFREDLYYRLNVIAVELPPLRQRVGDIEPLANHFIAKYATVNMKKVKGLDNECLKILQSYEFPGNIRELEHTIERAVILTKDETITKTSLFLHGITLNTMRSTLEVQPLEVNNKLNEHKDDTGDTGENTDSEPNMGDGTLADAERIMILQTLEKTDGNKTRAAEALGISVRTLRNKLNEYRDKGTDSL